MDIALVPWPVHLLGKLIYSSPWLFTEMGDLETSLVAKSVRQIPIDRPVFIAGLARSGSTLLLEIAASHPQAATHRNRDFPLVHAPIWWNKVVDMIPGHGGPPKERPHGDRMMVTGESPEAMEEPIWMAFFPHLHDPAVDNTLGRDSANRAFEEFYMDHIRKILHLRDGARYISKGNYNVSRIGYLARLFPDARFIIPVRSPVAHIGSLLRQHHRFTQIHRASSRALASMRQGGHFEFGLDLRPINLGGPNTPDGEQLRRAMLSEDRNTLLHGWAEYWRNIHSHIHTLLESDADIKARAMVVRFEDMLQAPERTIQSYLSFIGLEDDAIQARYASRVFAPDYYDPGFKYEEVALIMKETAGVRESFGY